MKVSTPIHFVPVRFKDRRHAALLRYRYLTRNHGSYVRSRLREIKSHIQYGFPADAKAMRFSVNIVCYTAVFSVVVGRSVA